MEQLSDKPEGVMLLIVSVDASGIYRAFSPNRFLPGLYVNIERKLYSPSWLRSIVEDGLGIKGIGQNFNIVEHIITPYLDLEDGSRALLVLGLIKKGFYVAPKTWSSFPQLLRSMPNTRNRVPYLKALQILSGALEQELDAIAVNDEIKSKIFDRILQ